MERTYQSPTPASASHYAKIVSDAALRRRLIGAAADIMDVAYAGSHDESGKSIPVVKDGVALEKSNYNGGFESHGCVHVPKSFLDEFDDTMFQVHVRGQSPDDF